MTLPTLLVTGDFVKTGGMDRANHALALHIARTGAPLHLVAFRVADDLLAFPNVHFHKLEKTAGSYFLSERLLDREGCAVAKQLAAQGGRTLVNGSNCTWPEFNWVHHVHHADIPPLAGGVLRRAKVAIQRAKYRRDEKRIVPRAKYVITTCERTKNDIVHHLGVPAERIKVIFMGVDGHLFKPADRTQREATRREMGLPLDRPIAAFVGALGDRRKGFDTLFSAWEQLCKDPAWDVDLAVVGRGMELPNWQKRAADAGLAERVRFLGFVKDLPAFLSSCDLHVLPSRYEGYSLATQEALACGIPAFITVTAGIADRYPENVRDLLVQDPNDVAGLVAQMRAWRRNPEDAARRLAPFSEKIRGHSWDDMAREIVAHMDAMGCQGKAPVA